MGTHMEVLKATEVKISSHSNRSYIVTASVYTSAGTWFCIPIAMQLKPQLITLTV
jgi:hypothetical protein